jgi:hypothetical protein
MEVNMSKLSKKFIFIIVVVVTIAALLLPAPRLAERLAGIEKPQAQLCLVREPLVPGDGGVETSSYTWAG